MMAVWASLIITNHTSNLLNLFLLLNWFLAAVIDFGHLPSGESFYVRLKKDEAKKDGS